MSRRYVYARLSGTDLSQSLKRLGMTMRQFARLSGANEERVRDWLDGREDIPHHVGVLCAVLTLPDAMEAAKAYTDKMVSDARDRD